MSVSVAQVVHNDAALLLWANGLLLARVLCAL